MLIKRATKPFYFCHSDSISLGIAIAVNHTIYNSCWWQMLFIYASIEYYLIFHNRRNEGVFNLNWNMVNSTNTFWNCLAKNLPIHNIPSYFIFKHILICYSYIRIIINIPKNLLHYDLLWLCFLYDIKIFGLGWYPQMKTPILNIHFEGTVVSSF